MATSAAKRVGHLSDRGFRRLFEWGALAAVLLVLAAVFLHWAHRVQGQAELAAVQETLGALRIAGVLADLKARLPGAAASVNPEPNPFELLRVPPTNYLGAMDADRALTASPGHWLFERDCRCVVYVPLDPDWLSSPSGGASLRFRISTDAGPVQLVAMEPYRWLGQRVQ